MIDKRCKICQLVRGRLIKAVQPGVRTIVAQPWSTVDIDLTGPYFPSSQNLYRWLLTVSCLYTKYMDVEPVIHISAQDITDALQRISYRLGAPSVIVSDNGPQFTSELFLRYCETRNITTKKVPRYSPHYAGFYERNHLILHRTMIALLLEQGATWTKKLPETMWLVNTRRLSADDDKDSGYSPFQLMFCRRGYQSVPIGHDREQIENPSFDERLVDGKRFHKQFETTWMDMRERVRNLLAGRVVSSSESIIPGCMVWSFKPKKHKLDIPWDGPYKVEKVNGPIITVGNGTKTWTEHLYNVMLVRSNSSSSGIVLKPILRVGTYLMWGSELEVGKVIGGHGNILEVEMFSITEDEDGIIRLKEIYLDESRTERAQRILCLIDEIKTNRLVVNRRGGLTRASASIVKRAIAERELSN